MEAAFIRRTIGAATGRPSAAMSEPLFPACLVYLDGEHARFLSTIAREMARESRYYAPVRYACQVTGLIVFDSALVPDMSSSARLCPACLVERSKPALRMT